jgi:transposase-like protein
MKGKMMSKEQKSRYKYSARFREKAVQMVAESKKPIAQVARELSLPAPTLRRWVMRENRYLISSELDIRSELERLQQENEELRLNNEFLGKSLSFFAAQYRSHHPSFKQREI